MQSLLAGGDVGMGGRGQRQAEGERAIREDGFHCLCVHALQLLCGRVSKLVG